MNTYLEKLFDKYNISQKNRYEIRQIYGLLPTDKQQNLINNFGKLASNIKIIEEEVNMEREILIWDALDNIRNVITKIRKEKSLEQTKWDIGFLKQKISS